MSPETRGKIGLATGVGRYCARSSFFLPASEDMALVVGGRVGFLEGFFGFLVWGFFFFYCFLVSA